MEETNNRRLEEARAALDSFDLVLTRALLSRVEDDWLTDDDSAVRDIILLELEARAMETEDLAALAEETFQEFKPLKKRWKRKKDR